MAPADFKKIQSSLGYNNREMAEFLHVSLRTIEVWRAGQGTTSHRAISDFAAMGITLATEKELLRRRKNQLNREYMARHKYSPPDRPGLRKLTEQERKEKTRSYQRAYKHARRTCDRSRLEAHYARYGRNNQWTEV